jgi:hypothetical protein
MAYAPALELLRLLDLMLPHLEAIRDNQGDANEHMKQLNVYLSEAKPILSEVVKHMGEDGEEFYDHVFEAGKIIYFKYCESEDMTRAINSLNAGLQDLKRAGLV